MGIDNNAGERAMKVAGVGAESLAVRRQAYRRPPEAFLYSLVVSCKANQVEPWAYLRDVFARWLAIASDSPELLNPPLPNR